MIVYTDKDIYECASAVQYADGVHLLEENGDIFLVIAQPWRIQKVEDGEILIVEQREPTISEVLNSILGVTE